MYVTPMSIRYGESVSRTVTTTPAAPIRVMTLADRFNTAAPQRHYNLAEALPDTRILDVMNIQVPRRIPTSAYQTLNRSGEFARVFRDFLAEHDLLSTLEEPDED